MRMVPLLVVSPGGCELVWWFVVVAVVGLITLSWLWTLELWAFEQRKNSHGTEFEKTEAEVLGS